MYNIIIISWEANIAFNIEIWKKNAQNLVLESSKNTECNCIFINSAVILIVIVVIIIGIYITITLIILAITVIVVVDVYIIMFIIIIINISSLSKLLTSSLPSSSSSSCYYCW